MTTRHDAIIATFDMFRELGRSPMECYAHLKALGVTPADMKDYVRQEAKYGDSGDAAWDAGMGTVDTEIWTDTYEG